MSNPQVVDSPPIIEMRNCTLQCSMMNSKKQGLGILIGDDADILIGQWHEGLLHGWYVYLTETSQAYGFMSYGSLQGFNVVQVDQSLTVCGNFHKNLVNDTCLVATADKYQITRFNNGIKEDILERGSYNRHTVYEIIKRSYTNQIIGLRKFMSYHLRESNDGNLAEIEINSMYRYYGFVNNDATQGEGLGIVFKNDVLYNYGLYKATELCGLGRLYDKDQIHDGIFTDGVLRGSGIKFNHNTNQYTFGNHSNQQGQFQTGYGFPTQKVRSLRRQYHLRSMEFLNEVIVMDRLVRIKMGDIMPEFKQQREPEETSVYARSTRSHKKTLDKSPSSRMVESSRPTHSYINENSPLKRMLREYDKQSARLTPERDRKKLQYDRTTHSPARSTTPKRRLIDDQDDYHSSVGQKQIYHRKEDIYSRPQNEQSMVVKDTFSMIRHMEQIERQKREDLERLHQTRSNKVSRW